jgi:hypothetical protein
MIVSGRCLQKKLFVSGRLRFSELLLVSGYN